MKMPLGADRVENIVSRRRYHELICEFDIDVSEAPPISPSSRNQVSSKYIVSSGNEQPFDHALSFTTLDDGQHYELHNHRDFSVFSGTFNSGRVWRRCVIGADTCNRGDVQLAPCNTTTHYCVRHEKRQKRY